MPQTIKPSQWIALAALMFGAVVTGGLYYVWPHAHWAVYAVLMFVASGIAYATWLQMIANEKIIDRGDWPNK